MKLRVPACLTFETARAEYGIQIWACVVMPEHAYYSQGATLLD